MQNLSEQGQSQLASLSDAMDIQLESEISLDEFEKAKSEEKNSAKGCASEDPDCYDSFQAYIGAELYNKRMFPHGCPSY